MGSIGVYRFCVGGGEEGKERRPRERKTKHQQLFRSNLNTYFETFEKVQKSRAGLGVILTLTRGRQITQGRLRPYNKLKANLGLMRPCLEKKTPSDKKKMVLFAQCLLLTRTSDTASWGFPRVSRWPAGLYDFLTPWVSTYTVLTMIKISNHAKPSSVLISNVSMCEKQEIAHQKEMLNKVWGSRAHSAKHGDISQVWTQGHACLLGLTIQKKHRDHCSVSCNGTWFWAEKLNARVLSADGQCPQYYKKKKTDI